MQLQNNYCTHFSASHILLKEGYKLKGLISKPINSRTRWELRTKKGNIVEFYNKENNITEEDLTNEAKIIVSKLQQLENIQIEIIGSWVWVGGNTFLVL